MSSRGDRGDIPPFRDYADNTIGYELFRERDLASLIAVVRLLNSFRVDVMRRGRSPRPTVAISLVFGVPLRGEIMV